MQRCAKVTDDVFKSGGYLSIRLDSSREHFPDDAKKNARCSLHKWVGVETEKGVSYCRTCNVNLCHLCFKYYHVTKDIVGEKEKLKKKYTPKTKRKPNKGKDN